MALLHPTATTVALATATVLTIGGAPAAHATPALAAAWSRPSCTSITGPTNVTIGLDTPTATGHGNKATESLASVVATRTPNVLISATDTGHSYSLDAGCTWQLVPGTAHMYGGPTLVPGAGRSAWSYVGTNITQVSPAGQQPMRTPRSRVSIHAAWGDPMRAEHVRIVLDDGTVMKSVNAGETWSEIGRVGPKIWTRSADIAQSDRRLVLVGKKPVYYHPIAPTADAADGGAAVSHDGGVTWTDVAGIGPDDLVTATRFAVADARVAWVIVHDAATAAERLLYSDDYGASFTAVADLPAAPDTSIDLRKPLPPSVVSTRTIVPDPVDPGVVWLGAGNRIEKFDRHTGSLTASQLRGEQPYYFVSRFALNPAVPGLVYLAWDRRPFVP